MNVNEEKEYKIFNYQNIVNLYQPVENGGLISMV